MADVEPATPPPVVRRKPGRPRVYVPVPGEPMTPQMKEAIANRERVKRMYDRDPEKYLTRMKENARARAQRTREELQKARDEAAELEALREMRDKLLNMVVTS